MTNISLSIMFLSFIHVVAFISSLLLFIADKYPIVWIHNGFSTSSSANGDLGCCDFWLLWIMLLWLLLFASLSCGTLFSFLLGRYLELEYTGCMVNLCLTFKKLRNCFPRFCCEILPSHQQNMRVPASLINSICYCLFISATKMGMKWYLTVISTLSSLMINIVEYVCILVGHLFIFFGNHLFKSVVFFFMFLIFLLLTGLFFIPDTSRYQTCVL